MKKIFPVLVIWLLFVPVSSKGQSEDWKHIGKGPQGHWYYRTEDVKRVSRGIVKVWAKEVPFDSNRLKYAYSLQLMVFDCVDNKIKFLQVITYTENARIVNKLDFIESGQDKWQDVVPNSIGEALLRFFCE